MKKSVTEQERDRVANQTAAEREAEAYRNAVVIARAKDGRPPDREAHRSAWNQRHEGSPS